MSEQDRRDCRAELAVLFFRDTCTEVFNNAFMNLDSSKVDVIEVFDEVVADCRRASYAAREQLCKIYDE